MDDSPDDEGQAADDSGSEGDEELREAVVVFVVCADVGAALGRMTSDS
jgi:hypothetical protein